MLEHCSASCYPTNTVRQLPTPRGLPRSFLMFDDVCPPPSVEPSLMDDLPSVVDNLRKDLDQSLELFLHHREGLAETLQAQQQYLIALLDKFTNDKHRELISSVPGGKPGPESTAPPDDAPKRASLSLARNPDKYLLEPNDWNSSQAQEEAGYSKRGYVSFAEAPDNHSLCDDRDSAADLDSAQGQEQATMHPATSEPKRSMFFNLKKRNSWQKILSSSDSIGLETSEHDFYKSSVSWYHEAFIMVVIILNAAVIGWSIKSFDSLIDKICTCTFTAIYTIDLAARVWRERSSFSCSTRRMFWILFDMLLLCIDVFYLVFRFSSKDESDFDKDLEILSTLRVFRLARIVHLIHYGSHMFQDLAYFVEVIHRSCRSFFWMITICGIIVYAFAVLMCQRAVSICDHAGVLPNDHDACILYDSVGHAALNLYVAILSGQSLQVLQYATEALGTVYAASFVFYVSFMRMVVLNAIAGLIFMMYQNVSKSEVELIREQKCRRMKHLEILTKLFNQMDLNESGGISLDEVELALNGDRLPALLESIGVDEKDARQLFACLDRDQSGALSIDEFIFGLLQIRGDAKAMDVWKLQVHAEWITQAVHDIRKNIDHMCGITNRGPDRLRDALDRVMGRNSLCDFKSETIAPLSQVTLPGVKKVTSFIECAEKRAMTLGELREVRALIQRQCAAEGWIDIYTKEKLQPPEVNLHHFNYYCICPLTAPEGVKMTGLDFIRPDIDLSDLVMLQVDSKGNCIAEGTVWQTSEDHIILVGLKKGRFQTDEEARLSHVNIDGVDVGIPRETIAVQSLSYKELISPVPLEPLWFCSHWWGEPILDFVLCCEQHATLRKLSVHQASYWVCAYANRQHSVAEDISGDPDNSAFWKAINVAEGVLLVLDSKATPFSRIWCDFELYCTLAAAKPLDIVTATGQGREAKILSQTPLPGETLFTKTERESSFPADLLVRGMCSYLQEGEASHPSDREQIFRCILKHSPAGSEHDLDLALEHALEHANALLHAFFALAAWPQAVKSGRVEDFDPDGPGLSLARIVRQGPMQNFNLSLCHISNVSDKDLQVLASISPSVISMALSFEGCANITDTGFTELVHALPHTVQDLSLDCLGCKYISDIGISALASSLSRDLQSLTLHFASCPAIGLEGISMLSDALPKKLKRFCAGFEGTQVDRRFNSTRELEKFINTNRRSRFLSQASTRKSLVSGQTFALRSTISDQASTLKSTISGQAADMMSRSASIGGVYFRPSVSWRSSEGSASVSSGQ